MTDSEQTEFQGQGKHQEILQICQKLFHETDDDFEKVKPLRKEKDFKELYEKKITFLQATFEAKIKEFNKQQEELITTLEKLKEASIPDSFKKKWLDDLQVKEEALGKNLDNLHYAIQIQ